MGLEIMMEVHKTSVRTTKTEKGRHVHGYSPLELWNFAHGPPAFHALQPGNESQTTQDGLRHVSERGQKAEREREGKYTSSDRTNEELRKKINMYANVVT